jgi:carboxymethylenebutenolidase
MTILQTEGLAQSVTGACPEGVRVAEDDRSINAQMLTIHGEGGPLHVYQVTPANMSAGPLPAVLVIHENRGLNEHIKDVTRRVAKAGYVALGVDLLSRQGGTAAFPDAEQAGAAYGRTRTEERISDLMSALYTIRDQSYVRRDRVGALGFCAGGGHVFDLAVYTDALAAAVVFYGAPPTPIELVANMTAPLLGIYAELDRTFTGRVPALITELTNRQKRFAIHIYENTGHAFHNDTGARYDPGAACDAWSKTVAFFSRHLNRA